MTVIRGDVYTREVYEEARTISDVAGDVFGQLILRGTTLERGYPEESPVLLVIERIGHGWTRRRKQPDPEDGFPVVVHVKFHDPVVVVVLSVLIAPRLCVAAADAFMSSGPAMLTGRLDAALEKREA
jgi:hypothetical protein